eukprot:scaffold3014_cov172-Amphora_coffeaeformis.AAC.1
MKRSKVEVITEARATKVTRDSISVYDKATKSTRDFPYGLIVWATGVEPGPLIRRLMSKLPEQSHYRSLKTDSQCQVLGAPGVYAIGDCADIDLQAEYEYKLGKIFGNLHNKFAAIGPPNDKRLTMKGLGKLVDRVKELSEHSVSAPMSKIYHTLSERYTNSNSNPDDAEGISQSELQDIAQKHLERQKILPPTAQVAHQQGEYLAKLLNQPKIDPVSSTWTFDHGPTFEFADMGQLVYVGGHMAALSIPASQDLSVSWDGSMTNYLWHAAYFGMLESTSARTELFFDWCKSSLFGRSTALDAICSSDNHIEELQRSEKAITNTPTRKWWKKIGL